MWIAAFCPASLSCISGFDLVRFIGVFWIAVFPTELCHLTSYPLAVLEPRKFLGAILGSNSLTCIVLVEFIKGNEQ